jgi:hypothetical protein
MLSALAVISPPQPNLELDQFGLNESGRLENYPTSRDFVSILLGGSSNRWANVDFAAAFLAAVRGAPSRPHIGRRALEPEAMPAMPRPARRLRPALEKVLRRPDGTARALEDEIQDLQRRVPGLAAYGKTGTLGKETGLSRIVVALLRWADEDRSEVAGGLVFSVVGENGAVEGQATRWLRDYLHDNKELVVREVSRPPGSR